jgi:Fur family ferric uptake transcriptional regulator
LSTTDAREAVLERFKAYLRTHHHPVTPQRLRVAEVLFGTHHHVSAEEILARLRERRRPVGKATVYRTLELLREAGLIREHDFGEGFKRYEPRPTRPHHEHLVCTRCGKVIEFVAPEIERVEREVAELHAFAPSHHKVEIYGLCSDCSEDR